ncbi:RCC1/BLIP-II [Violaceomyces palustris]|uniref:RCC1/BLIP-II n=1 Tax=Violaceomyces palustris TaxID=1673888 RepID=A0ACD0P4S5_9BASI|nr:RCC1/BLIP-II [Violaceomyces palustris]
MIRINPSPYRFNLHRLQHLASPSRSRPPHHLHRQHHHSAPHNRSSSPRPLQPSVALVATTTTATLALALLLSSLSSSSSSSSSPIHNDESRSINAKQPATSDLTQQEKMRQRASLQGVYAWGSNRYNVVAPDAPQITFVKSPRSIPYFDQVALRDIVLEEKHGVAVDANGDVLQWGLGFFDSTCRHPTPIEDIPLGRRREKSFSNEKSPMGPMALQPLPPVHTLKGKNIVKLAATEEKVFALSKDGKVYVFSAIRSLQLPTKPPVWSLNPLSLFGALDPPTIDHEVLTLSASSSLARGEVIADISAGQSHLLALTSRGKALSMPLDASANAFGQLGARKVFLNSPTNSNQAATLVETTFEPRMLQELEDIAEGSSGKAMQPPLPLTEPPSSIRYCTTLREVPALRSVKIAQISAGSEHSLARTCDGRVLGWGRHTHGQVGLGSNLALECVPVPSEIVLSKCFPNSSSDVRCTDIAAGGDNSFFMTTRREAGSGGVTEKIDLLAAGKGQWGTLGNAMWSQVQSQPVRVKTVSGLMEYSEATNKTHPVPVYSLSIGRPGHCALVLDTVEAAGHAAFGRDVMMWGANAAFQLGTGRRSNLAVPQHLKPLPPLTASAGDDQAEQQPQITAVDPQEQEKLREADLNSGALTHMPHNRLQLASKSRADTRLPQTTDDATVRTKKNVLIEETVKAGTVSSVVYWKIHA